MFLKCNDIKIELHPVVWKYLYPYLLRFSIKHNIDWTIWDTKNVVYIPEDKKEELKMMLEYIFEELMAECYKEPTQRQRTKNSTRFEKVFFKNRKYTLNYVTDIVGIIGYNLMYMINILSFIKAQLFTRWLYQMILNCKKEQAPENWTIQNLFAMYK